MTDFKREIDFFHHISPKLLKFVATSDDRSIFKQKRADDFSTVLDIGCENLIVESLSQYFPDDQILAEEGYSDTKIGDKRIWLIDPICGTDNLAKGLRTFCTNIALVENGTIIAACVVNYVEEEYFWATESADGLFVGDKLWEYKPASHSVKVDIDFGSVRSTDQVMRARHLRAIDRLVNNTYYDIVSLNSSLAFLYVALGKIDGMICVYNNPWDIAASGYFIQKLGGVMTDPDGVPWSVTSVGAVGAGTPEVHDTLLNSLKSDR
jgi:myo-inositol-1(or 4)-monophosphatase